MYERCPKCHHRPLPRDQALPAACPACGVILAKVAKAAEAAAALRTREAAALKIRDAAGSRTRDAAARVGAGLAATADDEAPVDGLRARLLHVPERVDVTRFWLRVLLLAAFAVWGLRLIALDHRTGEIGASFLHGPLLVFHEAGHVLFRPFGEWVSVLGGTLGQLLMPAIVAVAFLWTNRDPFGAALGLWLFGVSLLDVAPYVHDALDPQLMLLSGATGEAGGHDWMYLLASPGARAAAPALATAIHVAGAVVVLLALAWAAWVLRRQHGRLAGDVIHEA